MSPSLADCRIIGDFVIHGEIAPTREIVVANAQEGKCRAFSYQFLDQEGEPLAPTTFHQPPPGCAYITIPEDARYLVLRNNKDKAVVGID